MSHTAANDASGIFRSVRTLWSPAIPRPITAQRQVLLGMRFSSNKLRTRRRVEAALAVDERQIARVGHDVDDVPKHADGIAAVREIDQQNDRAGDRLPPEDQRNFRFAVAFAVHPLDKETR